MRALAGWIVALGLVVSPAMAETSGVGDKNNAPAAAEENSGSAATAKTSGTPAVVSNADPAAKPAASSMENQLQQLRDLLEAQARQLQEQSEQLKEQQQKMAEMDVALRAVKVATVATTGEPTEVAALAAPATAAVQPTAQPQQQDLGKKIDALENKLKSFGPFSFSGDIRLRDEPFFGGPANKSQVRNRERFRLRFYANAKLNDDISGGLALASGDINNPLTRNQTLTQFYARKPFALDLAFVNYTPHQFKPLTLTGGKIAYPWYRTELTWDNDLNPEGLAQKLEWKSEKWPFLRQFALVGFELPFAEVAPTSGPNQSIHQSVVYGGQIQTAWQLTSWLKFTADTAFYNYHNPDPIALALAQASAKNPQTPDVGLLPLAGPSLQNSVTTITKTTVVTADVGNPPVATALPTGVSTITSAQFASKFALSDTIAQFDIKTPAAAWPIRFLGDYVQNTRACANVPNILQTVAAVPANSSTATFKVANSLTGTAVTACNSHQRRGNWLEARFGRQQEKGDWQFSYTHMLIEREAVQGAFNFDDMRQNSNVTQHRVEVFYQALKNVQFAFTGLFGRPLASQEPMLKRMQFDVVYKF